MTAFRRRVRYHQARWREAKGHPIGSQPIVPRPGKPVRPAGSRLLLDYARETGANFLTANALAAVRARTPVTEAHQSFDHQRLWADLLWSPALGFNLAGDLAADLELADRAIHRWWPEAPGRLVGPSRPSCGWSTSAAVDAPAHQRPLGLGPLRRRPPGWQQRLRRALRPLPDAARDQSTFSSVTVEELLDAGALPETRSPPSATGTCPCDRGPCIDCCQSSARVTSIADAKEPPVTPSSPARAGA
jgi:hypothetical protein